MQCEYVILIFILCLILSITIKMLVNSNMCQIVHTIEFISAFTAIVFHLKDTNKYFVLAVLIFFMYRTIIRIIGDCMVALKENKEK